MKKNKKTIAPKSSSIKLKKPRFGASKHEASEKPEKAKDGKPPFFNLITWCSECNNRKVMMQKDDGPFQCKEGHSGFSRKSIKLYYEIAAIVKAAE